MITTLGRTIMLRSLTSIGEGFAETMGFGIGDTAPDPGDPSLEFEVVRTPVDVVDYDESSSLVLVRSTVPTNFLVEVHEIGLSTADERTDNNFVSDVVTFFDDSDDEWEGYDSLETSGVRSGNAAFRLDMGGGSGLVSKENNVIAFDDMLPSSTLALAYQRLGGAATAEFRAHVDASNYRAYGFSLDSGFGVERWTRSQFSETGSAPWDEIEYVEIEFSGAGPILLEGLRQDEFALESDILVARHVLSTPIQSTGLSEVQFEYAFEVTFD